MISYGQGCGNQIWTRSEGGRGGGSRFLKDGTDGTKIKVKLTDGGKDHVTKMADGWAVAIIKWRKQED